MNGKLFLVSTPIGNYSDITFRAVETLKTVDFIICEEYKEARRLLSHYKIDKELISLNEHNEKESADEILPRFIAGENAALISDCGAPLFSDPGHYLVELCLSRKIKVVPVPGVTSLMTAITTSGLHVEKFYYYGWLSPKKDGRRKELEKLKNINDIIIILDTPYRIKALLADIASVFNPHKNIVLAYELTKEKEEFFRGTITDVLETAKIKELKGEFVLLIDNRLYKKNR